MNKIKHDVMIFSPEQGWFDYLFSDLKNHSKVKVGKTKFCPCCENKFYDILCHLVFGYKFGKKYNQNLWARIVIKLICHKIKKIYPTNVVCIFNCKNLFAHNLLFLSELKKTNPNCKTVYWFTDIVSAVQHTLRHFPDIKLLDICNNYDLVITYDPYDAKKYGFQYIETPYSINRSLYVSQKNDIDLFYIGKAKIENKERFDKIIRIYESAKNKNLHVNFFVAEVPQRLQKYKDEIHYIKFMPYEEVLDKLQNCNCILEVSQKEETGTTLRFFESIVFNKKLIFTNPSMQNHPYFNKNNMHYLDCSKPQIDLDIDFIKSPAIPDTTTIQQLSPKLFLEKILKKLDIQNC